MFRKIPIESCSQRGQPRRREHPTKSLNQSLSAAPVAGWGHPEHNSNIARETLPGHFWSNPHAPAADLQLNLARLTHVGQHWRNLGQIWSMSAAGEQSLLEPCSGDFPSSSVGVFSERLSRDWRGGELWYRFV